MFIQSMMPSNHLILCHPFSSGPQPFPAPVFSSESALCITWPEYWNFSFSISPSKEYSELICLEPTGLISLLSKGLSRVFCNTIVQMHQFFSTQKALSLLYGPTLTSIHVVLVVQSLNPVQFFVIPWTAACQASLSFTISWGLLRLMKGTTEDGMVGWHH